MRLPIMLSGLLLLATAPALAGPYFVVVSGAYNGYDMATVNEFLDSVNEDTGEAAFDRLDSGGSFGLSLGRVFDRRIATAITYERLIATEESTSPSVVMKVKAPANAIRFQLAYALAKLGPVIPFVEGGVGILWNNGHVAYTDSLGRDRRHDFKGNVLTVEGLAGAEIRLNGRFGLDLAGGYRLGDISSPEWDASSFGGYGTFSGPGFDYTGFIARIGLRIGLNWETGDAAEKRDPSREATGWM